MQMTAHAKQGGMHTHRGAGFFRAPPAAASRLAAVIGASTAEPLRPLGTLGRTPVPGSTVGSGARAPFAFPEPEKRSAQYQPSAQPDNNQLGSGRARKTEARPKTKRKCDGAPWIALRPVHLKNIGRLQLEAASLPPTERDSAV